MMSETTTLPAETKSDEIHAGESAVSPEAKTSDWAEHLKTALEIGGAGGLFIAAGYIAESAHDDLLGINFPLNRSVNDYALTGGSFFIESMTKLLLHGWILTLGLATIVIALVIFWGVIHLSEKLAAKFSWSKFTSRSKRIRVVVYLVGVGVLFVWKGYRLDVPFIRMEGVLQRPPLCTTDALSTSTKNWFSFKQHDIWEKFVCTHITSQKDEFTPALKKRFECCWASPNENLKRSVPHETAVSGECGVFSLRALRDLAVPQASHNCLSVEQEYVIDAIATVFLIFVEVFLLRYGSRHLRGAEQVRRDGRLIAFRSLMFVLIVASSATLPYVYGKAIEKTTFPRGRIAFDSADFRGQPRVDLADILVIWADDKFVTVYRTDSFEFLHLSRTRVRYVSAESTDDIVRVYALWYTPRQQ